VVHRRIAALALLAGALALAAGCGGPAKGHPATLRTPGAQSGPGGQGGGEGGVIDPSPTPGGTESAGVAPSLNAVNGVMKTTGSSGVALTFDDGPSPEYTPQILGLLRKYGVKATFCLIGVNVRAHPDLVQAIVRDGHTLCNHTWTHDLSLGKRSADVIRSDMQRTNDEIHQAVPGAPIKYFRHPGGNFTPLAVRIAAELGMASIGWTVDPRDWDTGGRGTGAPMTGHIVDAVQRYTAAGAIVLSHDGGGNRQCTMDAYRTLLPYLTEHFTLVALPV
jgi:peptidoglycan/xylan/chitin deacetylase (PgdA/CDA1 family)